LKILLNLFTTDIQEPNFVELSEPFQTEGYIVFNFQFSLSEYYLGIIETLLNYLTVEHNISPYESKIVVQTNIMNLLIAWYRLYNDIIDDFILVDQHISNFQSIEVGLDVYIKQLSTFSAIEHDACHERLYYRNIQPISPNILKPFMESYQYDLLKPFEELEMNAIYQKNKVYKQYIYKKWNFKRGNSKRKLDHIIDLTKQRCYENDIQLGKITKPSGYYYTFHYILSLPIQDLQKMQIVMALNQQMTEEDKVKVTKYILNHLSIMEEKLPFRQVINFYSFIVSLRSDKNILSKMLKYLIKDDNHVEDHYSIVTNGLFFITKANQEEYSDYFLDRVEIMHKLKEYYKPKLRIKANQLDNHLVIVTGQLLSYNHAPTKIVIDYANNMIKYFPNLKIKIVVEDMFNYSPNELFFVYAFSSADSKTFREEHNKLLHPSINVHYSNDRLSRKQRLQDDINAISNFKPQWIMKMGAPDSLAVDQLYEFYPVLSMSMGGAEYSEFVDLYTGGHSEKTIINEYILRKIENRKYIHHVVGMHFPSPIEKTKSQFNIDENSFILVTVGNRLDAEINEEFAELIIKTLKENNGMTWCIVGSSSIRIVDSLCNDLNLNERVKYFKYISELLDFYTCCDVYINPFRKGGGNSAAMAMRAGLPIVSLNKESDVIAYIGKENGVEKGDFASEINRLYQDRNSIKLNQNLCMQGLRRNLTLNKQLCKL
jgi:hypothetical protein